MRRQALAVTVVADGAQYCGVPGMGDVIAFRKVKPGQRAEGLMLCRSGHHKWLIQKAQRFDVKQGRLVTVFRCSRCKAIRSETR